MCLRMCHIVLNSTLTRLKLAEKGRPQKHNMIEQVLAYNQCIAAEENRKRTWKEEIDTDYVWNNRFLPSMILHLPPHDIAQCIAASTKWNDKINTVEAFWERVVNATVSTKIVDAIEYHASKLFCCSYGLTNIINYESIALAFSLEKNLTVTHIGERFGNSLPSMLFNVTNCTPTPIDGVPYELAIVVYVQRSYLVCRRRTTQHRRGVPAARKSRTVNERT